MSKTEFVRLVTSDQPEAPYGQIVRDHLKPHIVLLLTDGESTQMPCGVAGTDTFGLGAVQAAALAELAGLGVAAVVGDADGAADWRASRTGVLR